VGAADIEIARPSNLRGDDRPAETTVDDGPQIERSPQEAPAGDADLRPRLERQAVDWRQKVSSRADDKIRLIVCNRAFDF
jgi:hypothetical protein